MKSHLVVLSLAVAWWGVVGALPAEEGPTIERRLPPAGIEVSEVERDRLVSAVEALGRRLEEARSKLGDERRASLLVDVEIYHKAVDYALRHGEFYKPAEPQKAHELLQTANARLDELLGGRSPWAEQRGLVVRGFRSQLDGSVQPYGLVIPAALDLKSRVPLYVWLHGRGDTTTDLNFIAARQSSAGNLVADGAIVLHPFGRYCNGWKSAGEIDVLEAIDAVARHYPIDRERIVLAGFSMGGAGAWHLGAHYTERWCAVHAGAGFAETARYQRLAPDRYPPWYEQTLWRLYDVPNYVRNLFNVPVVAYSGEEDKQIQAAEVMEEAFQEHGRGLTHLIGPGMGHKYHPDVLAEIRERLAGYAQRGRDRYPSEITFQTRTLRYNKYHWLEVLALDEHWEDTRVDARVTSEPRQLILATSNVAALRITRPWREGPDLDQGVRIEIDGQRLQAAAKRGEGLVLVKREGRWAVAERFPDDSGLRKLHGLQGPIDDAFLGPVLLVLPSGRAAHEAVARWVDFESRHAIDRWRMLMRGDVRVKLDREVSDGDIERYNVVLWGDPRSNGLLGRIAGRLPITWSEQSIVVGQQTFDAGGHVLSAVYPNPLNPRKYVVLNSGLTFREAHDGTNSLQNPKLPDWAVIDLGQPPDGTQSGRIAAADFFDERWQLRPERK